jgi:hypothetical protein
MPSTPRKLHKVGSPDVPPQQNGDHAWAHFRALMSGKPCPVCDYDASKSPVAIVMARLHAVFDSPVLGRLEWGAPPSDATDTEIRLAAAVRASAPAPKQAQSPLSEEQRAALEADAARQKDEAFKELFKLVNPGMNDERASGVAAKVAKGRRIYWAAREHGRTHAAALRAANKDGTKKGRWGRSRLYEHGARWKLEWEAEQPK